MVSPLALSWLSRFGETKPPGGGLGLRLRAILLIIRLPRYGGIGFGYINLIDHLAISHLLHVLGPARPLSPISGGLNYRRRAPSRSPFFYKLVVFPRVHQDIAQLPAVHLGAEASLTLAIGLLRLPFPPHVLSQVLLVVALPNLKVLVFVAQNAVGGAVIDGRALHAPHVHALALRFATRGFLGHQGLLHRPRRDPTQLLILQMLASIDGPAR